MQGSARSCPESLASPESLPPQFPTKLNCGGEKGGLEGLLGEKKDVALWVAQVWSDSSYHLPN